MKTKYIFLSEPIVVCSLV